MNIKGRLGDGNGKSSRKWLFFCWLNECKWLLNLLLSPSRPLLSNGIKALCCNSLKRSPIRPSDVRWKVDLSQQTLSQNKKIERSNWIHIQFYLKIFKTFMSSENRWPSKRAGDPSWITFKVAFVLKAFSGLLFILIIDCDWKLKIHDWK